ncbi:unnamed protein product, partial [Polarella glacialis]
ATVAPELAQVLYTYAEQRGEHVRLDWSGLELPSERLSAPAAEIDQIATVAPELAQVLYTYAEQRGEHVRLDWTEHFHVTTTPAAGTLVGATIYFDLAANDDGPHVSREEPSSSDKFTGYEPNAMDLLRAFDPNDAGGFARQHALEVHIAAGVSSADSPIPSSVQPVLNNTIVGDGFAEMVFMLQQTVSEQAAAIQKLEIEMEARKCQEEDGDITPFDFAATAAPGTASNAGAPAATAAAATAALVHGGHSASTAAVGAPAAAFSAAPRAEPQQQPSQLRQSRLDAEARLWQPAHLFGHAGAAPAVGAPAATAAPVLFGHQCPAMTASAFAPSSTAAVGAPVATATLVHDGRIGLIAAVGATVAIAAPVLTGHPGAGPVEGGEPTAAASAMPNFDLLSNLPQVLQNIADSLAILVARSNEADHKRAPNQVPVQESSPDDFEDWDGWGEWEEDAEYPPPDDYYDDEKFNRGAMPSHDEYSWWRYSAYASVIAASALPSKEVQAYLDVTCDPGVSMPDLLRPLPHVGTEGTRIHDKIGLEQYVDRLQRIRFELMGTPDALSEGFLFTLIKDQTEKLLRLQAIYAQWNLTPAASRSLDLLPDTMKRISSERRGSEAQKGSAHLITEITCYKCGGGAFQGNANGAKGNCKGLVECTFCKRKGWRTADTCWLNPASSSYKPDYQTPPVRRYHDIFWLQLLPFIFVDWATTAERSTGADFSARRGTLVGATIYFDLAANDDGPHVSREELLVKATEAASDLTILFAVPFLIILWGTCVLLSSGFPQARIRQTAHLEVPAFPPRYPPGWAKRWFLGTPRSRWGLDLFAGSCRLTSAFRALGLPVLTPVEISMGFDV